MKTCKIIFFAPESCKEKVKQAMFAAGAGHIGAYDCCSFESQGVGQFRPLEGSNPFIGQVGMIQTVAEYRVEMICVHPLVPQVIDALKLAHDYEEPAFEVIELLSFDDHRPKEQSGV